MAATEGSASGRDSGDFVQSLERGFAVLRCFDDPSALTLSEVAERTGMAPASARRYLHTLAALGYLGASGRRFYPRPRVLELAFPYFASSGISRSIEVEIARLAERTAESCALSVLDDHEVINVFCVNPPEGLSIQLRVGRRLPAYCTAMGRALLSDRTEPELRQHFGATDLIKHTDKTIDDVDALLAVVSEVRRRGYAVGDEEYEIGVRSVAMPVRDGSGRVVAAASVSTPTTRVPLNDLRGRLRAELHGAVQAIQSHFTASFQGATQAPMNFVYR